MSKHVNKNDSPIRRITEEEKNNRSAQKRAWPGKKHLSSEQDLPLPQPGQKNRIHSVLVALPVIMLVIGLYVYFRGESAQNNGEPVLAEMVSRTGTFKSVSEVSGIGTPKYYLWYSNGDQSRGVRISFEQFLELNVLNKGDPIELDLTPMVEGSPTLWAYKVERDGVVLLDVSEP